MSKKTSYKDNRASSKRYNDLRCMGFGLYTLDGIAYTVLPDKRIVKTFINHTGIHIITLNSDKRTSEERVLDAIETERVLRLIARVG